ALLCYSLSAWSQVRFKQFQKPLGTWSNVALSADGNVMAINLGGDIARWTATDGFLHLGQGDIFSSSIGISADGNTIVAGRVGPDGDTNPAMWQKATGWVDLGHPTEGCLIDGNWGDSWGVNGDGSIVVGLSWYCPGAEGFEWTSQTGIVGLGHPDGASSRATTISADGSTIVGFYEDPLQGNRRPVRWISGSTDLFLGEDIAGEAIAVSSDGSQIVGQAADNTGIGRGFYHTNAGGEVSLGVLNPNSTDESVAFGISDTGVAIGADIDVFDNFTSQPFVWTAKMGMRPLQAALVRKGTVIPKGLALTNVLAISADGSTIAGLWTDQKFNQGLWTVKFLGKSAFK
ncbi:MAG: hypothetical protein ACRD3B_07700, partial [Candidatus Sulfotelmatobacter sp.]